MRGALESWSRGVLDASPNSVVFAESSLRHSTTALLRSFSPSPQQQAANRQERRGRWFRYRHEQRIKLNVSADDETADVKSRLACRRSEQSADLGPWSIPLRAERRVARADGKPRHRRGESILNGPVLARGRAVLIPKRVGISLVGDYRYSDITLARSCILKYVRALHARIGYDRSEIEEVHVRFLEAGVGNKVAAIDDAVRGKAVHELRRIEGDVVGPPSIAQDVAALTDTQIVIQIGVGCAAG